MYLGYKCIPHYTLDQINLEDYDALVIPGGFEETGFYIDAFDERFLDVIRYFNKESKLIFSICIADLSIAKSGVLNGRNATTYNFEGSIRRKQL